MITLLWYSLFAGLFSLAGGVTLLIVKEIPKSIITALFSFAAGAFMAAALLDLLPEAIEMVGEPHPILLASLVGFSLFFFLERVIMYWTKEAHEHADHVHQEHTESLPYLLIAGDVFHNFIDGIVIALAFVANPALGFTAMLAIVAHEIPQEIGDFGVLLSLGWSKTKVLVVNILQSLAAIPGVVIGYYGAYLVEPYLPLLLGGTAGVFLYLAASDLIPEIHHQAEHKHVARVIIPFLVSIVIVGYLIMLAHGE